jgi:hypothetical protein
MTWSHTLALQAADCDAVSQLLVEPVHDSESLMCAWAGKTDSLYSVPTMILSLACQSYAHALLITVSIARLSEGSKEGAL